MQAVVFSVLRKSSTSARTNLIIWCGHLSCIVPMLSYVFILEHWKPYVCHHNLDTKVYLLQWISVSEIDTGNITILHSFLTSSICNFEFQPRFRSYLYYALYSILCLWMDLVNWLQSMMDCALFCQFVCSYDLPFVKFY